MEINIILNKEKYYSEIEFNVKIKNKKPILIKDLVLNFLGLEVISGKKFNFFNLNFDCLYFVFPKRKSCLHNAVPTQGIYYNVFNIHYCNFWLKIPQN